ncbi:MAG TPA: SagB/ThcOx family dehydrogenase [Polyangia bacterium]|nr:SagB/ThcOx family dehydrogenase [Polyangia bacterium]
MATRTKNILQEFQPLALQQHEQREESVGALFHEQSKLTPQRKNELGLRIAQLQSHPDLLRRISSSYKSYPYRPQVELPVARLEPGRDLQEVIVTRRSSRQFDPAAGLTLMELSNLLQLSYGVTGSIPIGEGILQYLRATPSAGGLYPLEIYLVVQRVEGLEPGLYHYRVAHHALEQLERGDQTEWLKRSEAEWGMSAAAPVTVFVSAVFGRQTVKYRDRGYRFVLMEAGILTQSLTLLAAYQGIHSCIMGGWVDDDVNGLFDLDGVNEGMLVGLCLGRGRQAAPK